MPAETLTFLGVEVFFETGLPLNQIRLENDGNFIVYDLPMPLTAEFFLDCRMNFLSHNVADCDRVLMNHEIFMNSPLRAHIRALAESAGSPTMPRADRFTMPQPRWQASPNLSVDWDRVVGTPSDPAAPAPTPDPEEQEEDVEDESVEELESDAGFWWPRRFGHTVAANDTPYIHGQAFSPELAGAVGKTNMGRYRVGVSVRIREIKLCFDEFIDESEYTVETRTRAMKKMRLKIYQYLQQRVRDSFDGEKEDCPEVWQCTDPFLEAAPEEEAATEQEEILNREYEVSFAPTPPQAATAGSMSVSEATLNAQEQVMVMRTQEMTDAVREMQAAQRELLPF